MNMKGGNICMDIIEYAKSINWNADYYDPHTGYLYHIADTGRALKFFQLPLPIMVSCDGVKIGHIRVDHLDVNDLIS